MFDPLYISKQWGRTVALENFDIHVKYDVRCTYLLKSIPGVIGNIRDRCLFSFLIRFVKKPDSTCSQRNSRFKIQFIYLFS